MADVPAVGKVNKPTLIVAGVAAVGAAVYAYWKKKKAAAAAAAATPAASAYGYGYAYNAAGYGYGAGSALTGAQQGIAQEYAYASGYGYGVTGGSTAVSPPPATNVPLNNSQWVQYAQQFLVSQGYNAGVVSTALNEYVSGQNVGGNQAIVEAAIAFEGNPPTAGANGYPPSINTSGANQGQPSGSSVTGGNASQYADNPPTNLRLVHNGKTGVQIQWNPVKNAKNYTVYTPGRTPVQFTTTNTIANIGSLKAGTSYNVEVWADPTPTGGPHATLEFTTTK